MATLGIGLLLAWDCLRPAGISNGYFLGEFVGVGSVYLMAVALVLATRLSWLEPWFGGLDRMYFWHKQYALSSVVVLAGHVLLTQTARENVSPEQATHLARSGLVLGVASGVGLLAFTVVSLAPVGRILHLPYERWLLLHRFIGLLVLLALVHGWALDPVIARSLPLRATYLVVGVTAVAAYGYDEVIRRRRDPRADYTVHHAEHPAPGILDVTLAPAGPAVLPMTGGRFVYLRVGGPHAWREHPFSVAGTYPDGSVRLTIRALGPGTTTLVKDLHEGVPATISGPYGMFDQPLGDSRQIWVGAGIGIAPFLGWLSHPRNDLPETHLFYAVPSPDQAPFLPELTAAQTTHPGLHVHPHFSDTDGLLTADRIQVVVGPLTPPTPTSSSADPPP